MFPLTKSSRGFFYWGSPPGEYYDNFALRFKFCRIVHVDSGKRSLLRKLNKKGYHAFIVTFSSVSSKVGVGKVLYFIITHSHRRIELTKEVIDFIMSIYSFNKRRGIYATNKRTI